MSKELYKRFLSLCQKWPKDETKVGRDYGEFFRKQLVGQFPHGEQSQVKDPLMVESALNALERIANNNHFNENSLKRSSASGLEVWACREAISNEGLAIFKERDETTLMKRLKQTLSIKFAKDPVVMNTQIKESNQTQKAIDEK